MVSNFALERVVRYVKLGLSLAIFLCLLQIIHLISVLHTAVFVKPDKMPSIYAISEKGYDPRMPADPVLYRLLIRRDYFVKQMWKKGKFKYSAVSCSMNNTIVGGVARHVMCQLPFYPQRRRNTQNVFFIGGQQDDSAFRDNFQLLTGSYFNLTIVNNTELDELVEKQLGLKDLVSEGQKFGKTEMIKYDIRPGQEILVYSLTTPVEACMLFVALRNYALANIRKFVWEMNFALYHVVHFQMLTQPIRVTFLTFLRHSCTLKYNVKGPFLMQQLKNGKQIMTRMRRK